MIPPKHLKNSFLVLIGKAIIVHVHLKSTIKYAPRTSALILISGGFVA